MSSVCLSYAINHSLSRYSSIQANLVECGNLGRFAFLEAEEGMGTIQLTSQIVNRKVRNVLIKFFD
jgi:hypothetical protein